MPLLSLDHIQFVSLQKNPAGDDRQLLGQCPNVLHVGDEFQDFADTAGAIAALDLVIAVDTSVAHLAGAMGKVVGLLLPSSPDWRWLLKRDDSPWYPTMRLFRQSASGDWDGVIARVREELIGVAQRTFPA
jgi:ADP-heptose:LPS heptosyltransferase